MTDLETLVPNFSWVLPGRLAGSGMPARGQGALAGDAYVGLYENGLRTIASLLERPSPSAALEAAGLVSLHFPIGDFGTPRDPQAFAAFVDAVHAEVLAGRPTLVHCWAGIGRCGMFLATYLARHEGVAPMDAVRRIRRLRPGSIETSDQVAVVLELGGVGR